MDGLILHGTRIFMLVQSALLPTVLELAHSVGHEGVQKTLHRLRGQFYIEGDRAHVRDFVHACAVCKNKVDPLQPAGLLQPLEVPSQVWSDISLDFIEGLPRVNGKSVILTVVDRFSKHAHFIVSVIRIQRHRLPRRSSRPSFACTGSPTPLSATGIPCSLAMCGGICSSWRGSNSASVRCSTRKLTASRKQ